MSAATEPSPASPGSPWLEALIANIQDAIIIVDHSGKTLFESPSAPVLLGDESEGVEASGLPPGSAFGIDRIHPDERDAVVRSFERTIAVPGAVARATYRFKRFDGEWKHLEAVAKNLLHDPELRGVLITLRDVTDRIRAIEAAERAGAATDEFFSRMSHELRTPLHAILGWAQLIDPDGRPEIAEAVGQILQAGEHLLRLVDEALDLAAVREGRIVLDIEAVEIVSLIAEALEMIRPLAARRDITVRHEPGEGVDGCVILADRSRLRQVLINLLSNAVKFSRYAGDVVVATRVEAEAVRIAVLDSGPGIPEDRLAEVFERFERLGMDAAGVEGSGLGLAISRRLVETMRGTIGVESRPGAGAEFWLRLPISEMYVSARVDHRSRIAAEPRPLA